MEDQGLASVSSIYDTFDSAHNTLASCKAALSAAHETDKHVAAAQSALNDDIKLRIDAVHKAQHLVASAVGKVKKLTPGLSAKKVKAALMQCNKSISSAHKEVDAIINGSKKLTLKAADELQKANDSSSKFAAAAEDAKSRSLTAKRLIEGVKGNGANTRYSKAATSATQSAQQAEKMLSAAKVSTKHLLEAMKVLQAEKTHGVHVDLMKALVGLMQAKQEVQIGLDRADAVDALHSEWMRQYLDLVNSNKHLQKYMADKTQNTQSPMIARKVMDHAVDSTTKALDAAGATERKFQMHSTIFRKSKSYDESS